MPARTPAPPHDGRPIRVCCVCLGNICRSPMAAALLDAHAARSDTVLRISSAGTASWHVGRSAHPATVAALAARGIPIAHAARTFTRADFADLDLVLAMDHANATDLDALAGTPHDRGKVHLIRDFDPDGPRAREVPDPYSQGAEVYRQVYDMLDAACRGLIARIDADGPPPWRVTVDGRQ